MKPAPRPRDETQRLRALRTIQVLDTPADSRLDHITRLATRMFGVPTALVSLVDTDRQWFKSRIGLDATETPRDVSFCGHAIIEDGLFVVEDALGDERFCDNPLVVGGPNVKFYAGCPLKALSGHRLGTLCIIDSKPRTFSQADREMLRDLAQLAEDQLRAIALARMDELTQVSNRRGFDILARQALALSSRAGQPSTLLVIDLDGFKQINDTHGHEAGDLTLKQFARCLVSACRESDAVGRIGGDEFCIFLPGTDATGAWRVVERLKEVVATANAAGEAPGQMRFSVGMAVSRQSQGETVETLMAEADEQMYAAKQAGKRPEAVEPAPADFAI